MYKYIFYIVFVLLKMILEKTLHDVAFAESSVWKLWTISFVRFICFIWYVVWFKLYCLAMPRDFKFIEKRIHPPDDLSPLSPPPYPLRGKRRYPLVREKRIIVTSYCSNCEEFRFISVRNLIFHLIFRLVFQNFRLSITIIY